MKIQQGETIQELLKNKETEHSNFGIIRFSNSDTKHRLQFGNQFKDMLYAKDFVLEHNFDFQIPVDLQQIKRQQFNITDSTFFQNIQKNMHRFFVETVYNIISVTFKLIRKEQLSQKEGKQYAGKNILMNINTIFCKVMTSLDEKQLFTKDQLSQLRQALMEEVDGSIQNIMINLDSLYPQIQPSGGSHRMLSYISSRNRIDEEEYDLIFIEDIRIGEYFKFQETYINSDGDYTKFVMRVINAAIRVSSQCEDDQLDRTNREIFDEFSEKIFWISQQKTFNSVIKDLNTKEVLTSERNSSHSSGSKKKQEKSSHDQKSDRSENINFQKSLTNFFMETFESESNSKKKKDSQEQEGPSNRFFENASQNYLDSVSNMKIQQKCSSGQKIPFFIKEFSKHEIQASLFSSKHSSILRIITKWSEYLQDFFDNPSKLIYSRQSPFKTINNELIYIDRGEQGQIKLIENLEIAKQKLSQEHQFLKQQCMQLTGQLLSRKSQNPKNVAYFSDTRTLASQIKVAMTRLKLDYLNIQIHHLLEAGKNIKTKKGNYADISLVTFRVCDLLRSKLKCNQNGFINIVKTVKLLDQKQEFKGKFKLLRIKNKLDEPSSNIIINYLLMGKVQCQLQVSVQEVKKQDSKFYSINHFIYELKRGQFGPVTQLAIMISQLDPLIASCKEEPYEEKMSYKKKKTLSSKYDNEELKKQERMIENRVFQCNQCKKIIANEHESIYKDEKLKRCSKCITKGTNPENYLKQSFNKQYLVQKLKFGQITRIQSLKQLQKNHARQQYYIIMVMDKKGQLCHYICINSFEEGKCFKIPLTYSLLFNFENSDFDFRTLESINITNQIIEEKLTGRCLQQLWYSINFQKFIGYYAEIVKKDQYCLFGKVIQFVTKYKAFRLEKTFIKNIKFKSGVVDISASQNKAQILQQLGENRSLSGTKKLLYRKYKDLDSSKIEHLNASQINRDTKTNYLKWLSKPSFEGLQNLDLSGNCIEGLRLFHQNLTSLNLSNNNIEQYNFTSDNKLVQLNLSNNKLKSFNLQDLPNLQKLDISQNKFNNELNFFQSAKLIQLKATRTNLTSIKLNLPQLKVLFLEDNHLTKLSLEILVLLRILNLQSNVISQLDFSKNIRLQQLNLNNNALLTLNVQPLNKLTNIQLRNNPFMADIIIKGKRKLNFVDFSQNNIELLQLQNVPSLKVLNFDETKIDQKKWEQQNWSIVVNLSSMTLSNNFLSALHFTHFRQLIFLDLSNNKTLFELSLVNLANLKYLNISQNNIKQVKLQDLFSLTDLLWPTTFQTFILQNISKLSKPLKIADKHFSKLRLKNIAALQSLTIQKTSGMVQIDYLPQLLTLSLTDLTMSQSIILKDLTHLRHLSIIDTNKKSFISKELPPSIEKLSGNQRMLLSIDYESLPKLTNVVVLSSYSSIQEIQKKINNKKVQISAQGKRKSGMKKSEHEKKSVSFKDGTQ